MNKNIVRALRLPFITASVIPFVFGSLLPKGNFNFFTFFLGLISVIFTHLSANLINDYADSKSGVDWHDKKYYIFFGGTKLIQNQTFTERFYFNLAVGCLAVALFSALILALTLKSLLVIALYLIILFLSWAYSTFTLRFSYRRMGEFVIFLLFGPVLVMGAYYIQTKIFPTPEGLLLSLPFGFFTTAVLFANEVPDFPQDLKSGKLTWVSLIGQDKAFLMYMFLEWLAYLSLSAAVVFGYLDPVCLFSFLFVIMIVQAGSIIKDSYNDKIKLMKSSQLTIAVQAFVGIIMILGVII